MSPETVGDGEIEAVVEDAGLLSTLDWFTEPWRTEFFNMKGPVISLFLPWRATMFYGKAQTL